MKNTKKLSIFAAIILFFTFSLTGFKIIKKKLNPKLTKLQLLTH